MALLAVLACQIGLVLVLLKFGEDIPCHDRQGSRGFDCGLKGGDGRIPAAPQLADINWEVRRAPIKRYARGTMVEVLTATCLPALEWHRETFPNQDFADVPSSCL